MLAIHKQHDTFYNELTYAYTYAYTYSYTYTYICFI